MTINDAFNRVRNDQVLSILPASAWGMTCEGYWHEDHMQSFRRKHGRERCELISESEKRLEVQLYE